MKKGDSLRKKLFASLKRGTGEAYIIVRDNPERDFSHLIIKAAKKNFAYDGQSESSRAEYIFRIIQISKNQAKIRTEILKELQVEASSWSLTHLFDLAKHYALAGDEEAKKSIYQAFKGEDWIGTGELLELDGLKALFFIADKIGRQIASDDDDYGNYWIVENFQDANPDLKVLKELKKQAKQNKYIAIYVKSIEKDLLNPYKYKRGNYNFDSILDIIEDESKRIIPRSAINKLSGKQIKYLANNFKNENDLIKIEKYLDVFSIKKYPLSIEHLFKYTSEEYKDSVKYNAIDALALLTSKKIREYALKQIENINLYEDYYVDLLIHNYQMGDEKLLTKLIQRINNEGIIERLVRSCCRIYRTNKVKECKEPFVALYNKMNCGICRHDVVDLMAKNGILPDRILSEIEFDSHKETRELFRELTKKN